MPLSDVKINFELEFRGLKMKRGALLLGVLFLVSCGSISSVPVSVPITEIPSYLKGVSAETSNAEVDYTSYRNIAPISNLPEGLKDGVKGCACVNDAYFGPGWNPGEVIEADFPTQENIYGVALYLGCSAEHGETGSGYVEALINGTYVPVAEFKNFGYATGKFFLPFSKVIRTKGLRFVMTSGGGGDKNLCISEIEILSK